MVWGGGGVTLKAQFLLHFYVFSGSINMGLDMLSIRLVVAILAPRPTTWNEVVPIPIVPTLLV